MVMTQQVLAKQLTEYLQHNVTIEQLVEWAERAMMEAEFEAFLSRLGYRAKMSSTQHDLHAAIPDS